MKPEDSDIHSLFALQRKQYCVPHYQRPQAWSAERHWRPLFADVETKANAWLSNTEPSSHYLGAVVLASRPSDTLKGIDRVLVIDGQQRLSTLQYFLQALRIVAIECNWADGKESVEATLRNASEGLMDRPEVQRHKLWPTFRDREAHLQVMTADSMAALRERFEGSFTRAGTLYKNVEHARSLAATCFFYDQIYEWLGDVSGEAAIKALNCMRLAITKSLQIILLWLEKDDDPQVIFECLNGRGEPLRATDLIKNFIFMSAEAESSGGQRDQLDEDSELFKAWSELDGAIWMEDVARGRITKTRLEWLVYYTLQAETGLELDTSRTYESYQKWAAPRTGTKLSSMKQVDTLRDHSKNLLALIEEDLSHPIGSLGRVANALDVTTVTPVALAIADMCDPKEQEAMFNALESYLIRRESCGLTKKNYNIVFLSLLRELQRSGFTLAILSKQLVSLEGEASLWPDDSQFNKALSSRGIYGGGAALGLCRVLLARAAVHIGATTAAEVAWAPNWSSLQVEHMLPQSWYEHWILPDGSSVTEEDARQAAVATEDQIKMQPTWQVILKRERLKNTVGNLTILNSALNNEIKNHAWKVKRDAIRSNTQLRMNFDLASLDTWDDALIEQRSQAIFEIAVKEWPRQL